MKKIATLLLIVIATSIALSSYAQSHPKLEEYKQALIGKFNNGNDTYTFTGGKIIRERTTDSTYTRDEGSYTVKQKPRSTAFTINMNWKKGYKIENSVKTKYKKDDMYNTWSFMGGYFRNDNTDVLVVIYPYTSGDKYVDYNRIKE